MANVHTELWTGQMIKAFREDDKNLGWYNRIPAKNSAVLADVLHFVKLGGDPKVLMNNKSYPLNVTTLKDTDKPISLDKFETEATKITKDDLRTASYDIIDSHTERHKEAILQYRMERALYNIAPQAHKEGSPIIKKAGSVLTPKDVLKLKIAFDKMKVPREGRVLVLTPEHVADLCGSEQNFANQYNINQKEGHIARLWGFDIYECSYLPYYGSNDELKAFGSVTVGSDKQGSIAFHDKSMVRADGSIELFVTEANATNRFDLIGFTQYSVCLPLRSENCTATLL